MDRIPYKEGEPPPEGNYVLADIQDEAGNSEGLFWIQADNLKTSPPRHEDIENIIPVLRWIWRHLREHVTWCRSFEDFELGFLRDANPEVEVALWVRATYAYLQFLHENPTTANGEGAFAAVTHLMNRREDLVTPQAAADRLRELWGSEFPKQSFAFENFTGDGHLETMEQHLQ